jgi:hypothetical protein
MGIVIQTYNGGFSIEGMAPLWLTKGCSLSARYSDTGELLSSDIISNRSGSLRGADGTAILGYLQDAGNAEATNQTNQ